MTNVILNENDNHYQVIIINGVNKVRLLNCKKSKKYRVKNLPDIHLLKALGIRQGTNFKVQTKQPFGGPVVVKVGNRSLAISKEFANEIIVEEVS